MTIARFARVGEVSVPAELTAAERGRHDRLRFAADRDAYTAAHLLVRACAGELLGIAPGRLRLQQHCPRCGATDHGRPSIAGEPQVWVSLSHTRGHVAAVAARTPCGIDVQTTAGSIPGSAITDRERAWLDAQADSLPAFTRLWVRKEALVKAGLADEPGALDVLGPDAVTLGHGADVLGPDAGALGHGVVAFGPGAAPAGRPAVAAGPVDRLSGFTLSDWAGPADPLGAPVVWGCVAVHDE